jgi:hypothetical protein
VGLPYIRGISEKFEKAFNRHDVGVYHIPTGTIKQSLVHPKDKLETHKKCGAIYHIQCKDCTADYIGETSRPLGVRLKEHERTLGSRTAVGEHCAATGHKIKTIEVKIVEQESGWFKRKVKEAIKIRIHRPTMNRDEGYELPAIYSGVLSRDPSWVM